MGSHTHAHTFQHGLNEQPSRIFISTTQRERGDKTKVIGLRYRPCFVTAKECAFVARPPQMQWNRRGANVSTILSADLRRDSTIRSGLIHAELELTSMARASGIPTGTCSCMINTSKVVLNQCFYSMCRVYPRTYQMRASRRVIKQRLHIPAPKKGLLSVTRHKVAQRYYQASNFAGTQITSWSEVPEGRTLRPSPEST